MSIHLLSLPAETLDSITNYLPHPVDGLNLSMTCRYFNQHLSTQHNNKFWHTMFSNGHSANIYVHRPDTNSFSIGKPGLAYEPGQDYKSYVLRALLQNGCQFCLTHMASPNSKRDRDSRMCQVHGFKICMGCLKEHTTSKTLLPPLLSHLSEPANESSNSYKQIPRPWPRHLHKPAQI